MANTPPTSSPKKRVRMRDVANRCGVSISTVSLVLSGDARIPEDTARKVLQTVKAMEYRPSILARSLAKKGSRTIGVILPESAFQKNQAYYYEILQGIHSQTQPAGYKMLVEAANQIFLDRRYYLRLLKEQSADGIIYLAAKSRDTFLSEMARENYPFVMLGSRADGVDLPSVTGDEVLGAKIATEHLISLGHTAIAHVTGSLDSSSGRDRQRGYQQALTEKGIKLNPSWVFSGEFDIQQAEKVASSIVQSKVTAVFAANDIMAYGILKGLRALNRKVPEDIAVVGMDDLPISSWLNPPLTTVRMNIAELASMAAQFVLKMLQSPLTSRNLLQNTPSPQLIKRMSCGSPN